MLLTLLLPLTALAATDPEERLQQKRQAIMRDSLKNDHAPRTCARLEAYALPPAPPPQCKDVKEYWDRLSELRAGNLKTCRAEDDVFAELMRAPETCPKDIFARIDITERASEPTEEAVKHLNSSETVRKLEESLDDVPSGELADPGCRRSEQALFEFRYRHAWIAEGHATETSEKIDRTCDLR